jgi:sugar-specific transcriptional regulator TrmB
MAQPDSLIDLLQQLGFTQYEAQCYLGLLRQHPLNGSQLSTVSGVPRSMVYQTLDRLEAKEAVVRIRSKPGEPQQYEPVAPRLVIARLSAQFQATCEQAEAALSALGETPTADIVLNIVGADEILRRAAMLVRHSRLRLGLMGGSQELAALAPELRAAAARGVVLRLVSIGPAPQVDGQIITFLGENVSAPTRFLVVIADTASLLMATFAPDAQATAVLTENPLLVRLHSAFLNTEYYLVRAANRHPALVGQMLEEVLEPEDRERYASIIRFFQRRARSVQPEADEKESTT